MRCWLCLYYSVSHNNQSEHTCNSYLLYAATDNCVKNNCLSTQILALYYKFTDMVLERCVGMFVCVCVGGWVGGWGGPGGVMF